ncbi:MAG: AmmeMemoRadiSam system protein B [Acidobacteria bacterium]|nr:MAG: AmmeMemoRadiSam system protein B [Acidobacteriota bacterium]
MGDHRPPPSLTHPESGFTIFSCPANRYGSLRSKAGFIPRGSKPSRGIWIPTSPARRTPPALSSAPWVAWFPTGAPLAMMSEGAWLTPLGEAAVDAELGRALRKACPLVSEDSAAHAEEHSLEVQLPFLQRWVGGFTFLPVSIGVGGYAALESLGRGVAQTVAAQAEPSLIIASSDMNHYEADGITRVKDRKAIDRILALDPQGLYDVLRREDISMCGYGPTVALLTAAKELGAKFAELVKYATSADTGGDRAALPSDFRRP